MTDPSFHPPYPEEGDGREARALWAAHLEGCAACRARAAATDPTRLFALLGRRPLPLSALDEVSAAVSAAVSREAPEPAGRLLAVRIAATAAAAILAVAGTILSIAPERRASSTAAPPARAHVTVLDAESDTRVVDLTLGDTQVVMIYDARVRP